MSSPVKRSISRLTASLIAMGTAFGLAILMVLKQYDPAVIVTVVTGTSLAAAELIRRLQTPPSQAPYRVRQPDRTPESDGTATRAHTSQLDGTSEAQS